MQPLIRKMNPDGPRRTRRPVAFAIVAGLALTACAGGGVHHRLPNPQWAALTGLPPEQVAGVSTTQRGGLVLVSTDVTAAHAAAVPTHLCAASHRNPAMPGVLQPVAGHTTIRKIVVTCQG